MYEEYPCGPVVIATVQLHSTKPELRSCAGSNPARGVSEIRDGEDLWQWSRLEIRLNAFRRSTIRQKQFIIITKENVLLGSVFISKLGKNGTKFQLAIKFGSLSQKNVLSFAWKLFSNTFRKQKHHLAYIWHILIVPVDFLPFPWDFWQNWVVKMTYGVTMI